MFPKVQTDKTTGFLMGQLKGGGGMFNRVFLKLITFVVQE